MNNHFNITVSKATKRRIKEYTLLALQLIGMTILASATLFLLWLFMWTCYDLGIKM